ncbi:MAG: hypothetical protein JXR25_12425 [Pontiellaceae bacterium]|nr:hypothetical protein [Pontiellaceae bacterium]MBN2785621.1 hypothetical protein [Pontiellaceae bacterium]
MPLKLSKWLGTGAGREPFDSSQFNDPVAMQTRWSPLCGGGTNFRTRRLVMPEPGRVEFRTTAGAYFGSIIFGLFGLLALFFAFTILFPRPECEVARPAGLIPGFVGMIFCTVAIWLFRRFTLPVTFDQAHGFFWKGPLSPRDAMQPDEVKCHCRLIDIHALQLISELCSGDKSSFYSYELNLILKSGERINVFDHGSLKAARADAHTLAEYLGCPLWDAVRR